MKKIFGLLFLALMTINCYSQNKVRGELRTEINGFQWYCYKGTEAYDVNGVKLFNDLKGIKSIRFSAADKNDEGIFLVRYKDIIGLCDGAFTIRGECIGYSSAYSDNMHIRRIAVSFTNPNRQCYYTEFGHGIISFAH